MGTVPGEKIDNSRLGPKRNIGVCSTNLRLFAMAKYLKRMEAKLDRLVLNACKSISFNLGQIVDFL